MCEKSVLVPILFILTVVMTFGQVKKTAMSAPDNWKSEIIPFPMEFAPEINFVGFADLRFSPGWSDSTSQEFWTYSFVWHIEKDSAMTENRLAENFNSYYDGLMLVGLKSKTDATDSNKLNKTLCLFVKTNKGFIGKIRVYDRFFTKDYITLNIKVKESFCTKTNKQFILCQVSLKTIGQEVWDIFNDVRLNVNCN